MNTLQFRIGRVLCWAIQHNPAYLISAALTAVGARLLLVSPADPAGDVRLILMTLAALQIYEWTVAAILIALHRAQRSPEDKPSLLLVAAVFWTGPIAATLEMIAFRPEIGTYLAAGACLIALGEMRSCSRVLGLQMTGAAQAVGAACVILLAAAAPLLKTPESDSGVNELYLYVAWWVFAGVILGCIGAVRSHRKRAALQSDAISLSGAGQELAFLGITIAATAVHLVGMNYGFFCHAANFYASPVLVALSIVCFEILVTNFRRKAWVLAIPSALPAIAILLALEPFNAQMPLERLPTWARDPLVSMSIPAALAWWFGYARHRWSILLHAGNAACAVAALQITRGMEIGLPRVDSPTPLIPLYVVMGYLAVTAWLRRSRVEALVALCIHLVATSMAVGGRTPADTLIICLVAGWSVLAGIHIAACGPRLWMRLTPIAFMAIVPWMLNSAPTFRQQIAAHSVDLMAVLFSIGHYWRWTRYREVAVLLASGHMAGLAGYWTLQGMRPAAVVLVLAGFALLAGGAMISWWKAGLLKRVAAVNVDARADQAGRELHGASGP